ncbi:6182_t:CDS:2 [Funneliformis geosporum]|uniref:11845_t:CDS:1 n=1 Tax=Funneliformis geosporum TaxID=1117311 RepID=A0A9W4WVT8_9GLOM|nr:6182_t:CDS:2 [Funneliformis geosporum]CAI2167364.1 11845_t:CDS:2 [Funneliformis geosporum]
MRNLLFDEKSNSIIRGAMRNLSRHRYPFAKISRELLPHYSARQIGHHWRNVLCPALNHGPWVRFEQQYIVYWILQNRTSNGRIDWKILRQVLKSKFGLLRSENRIKNYWYSKKKCLPDEFDQSSIDPNILAYIEGNATPVASNQENSRMNVEYILNNHDEIDPVSPAASVAPILVHPFCSLDDFRMKIPFIINDDNDFMKYNPLCKNEVV